MSGHALPGFRPFEGLPDLPVFTELRRRRQFVAWDRVMKPGVAKPAKVPIDPHTGDFAKVDDAATWGTYEEAVGRAQADELPGVGVVLTADGHWVGGDLDGVRDPVAGTFAPWVAELIALGETYAEISPSGEGVRFIARRLGDERGTKFDPASVEIYLSGRYLTLTGQHIPGTPTEIRPAPRTLAALHARVDAFRAAAAAEKARAAEAERQAQEANGQTRSGASKSRSGLFGDGFFKRVNSASLENLSAWVLSIWPGAKFQLGTRAYRISSAMLGRDLEEDLSLSPEGIVDFGVADMGDGRDGKRTAIDVVIEHAGAADATAAALWLCDRLGIDPGSLGWNGRRATASAGGAGTTASEGGTDAAAKNDIVTEDSAALEFAERHGGRLSFCHDAGAWFIWDDVRWSQNRTNLAYQFARLLARDLAENEAAKLRYVISKTSFASGVERYSRSDPVFAVTTEVWDRDPWLLGTPEGTVDLKTGELRKARAEDRITKLTAVAPAPSASCPTWLGFLDDVTRRDQDYIRFIQQWSGYCLTGDTREQALCFAYGGGGNGKGVLIHTLAGILQDYALNAAMETFTASKGDRHPTEIAALRGARLVTASETEQGRQWAESRIKQLTGGDTMRARFMRQDEFEFTPVLKLLIIGNNKPGLSTVDDAARRRFNLLPFLFKPAKPDPRLEEKLRAEWPAILRWMIDGCLDWQANGLVRPAAVTDATSDYFAAQDVFSQWLDEKCIVDQGNSHRKATTQELFNSWSAFAKARNEPAGSVKAFSEGFEKRGFIRLVNVPTGLGTRARGFSGVELRAETSHHGEG